MADRAYTGDADPTSSTSEWNRLDYAVRSILSYLGTATVARVVSVTNSGSLDPVGFVDINPLVAMVDGVNQAVPHGTIHRVPYFRLQGGTSAIIMDPVVGDLGIVVFASHDISAVKKNKGPSNPGSGRRFSMADGLYIGGVLNGTPEQYIRFSGEGVEIKAPTIKLLGDVQIVGGGLSSERDITTMTRLVVDGVTVAVP